MWNSTRFPKSRYFWGFRFRDSPGSKLLKLDIFLASSAPMEDHIPPAEGSDRFVRVGSCEPYLLLMAEILHHLECIWKPINNGKNYLSTGAGFQLSAVWFILMNHTITTSDRFRALQSNLLFCRHFPRKKKSTWNWWSASFLDGWEKGNLSRCSFRSPRACGKWSKYTPVN